MTQLPDVSCTVKVIENADGTRTPDGGAIFSGNATVRYVVVNDSNNVAGPLTVVGIEVSERDILHGVALQSAGFAPTPSM